MSKTLSLALAIAVSITSTAQSGTLKVIHSFCGSNEGGEPYGKLVRDSAGNLFGTAAYYGSSANAGTIFELVRPTTSEGNWTSRTLLRFNGKNGTTPLSELVFDQAGNLYGTTLGNGTSDRGTVFELVRPATGQSAWTLKTLERFTGDNGADPLSGVVLDKTGNVYGTTNMGGTHNIGTAFRLLRPAQGKTAWTHKTLVSFDGSNGSNPIGSLIFDKSGALYGTTAGISAQGFDGTVFQLKPPSQGTANWKLSTLKKFPNYSASYSALVFDGAGNLYGTTRGHVGASATSLGTVFELVHPASGSASWTRKTLATFGPTDDPKGPLVFDRGGNLYGVTLSGGTSGNGTLFQLNKPAAGQVNWTKKTLVSFSDVTGISPQGTPISDVSGNLFGTTMFGGPGYGGGGCQPGTVYELPK